MALGSGLRLASISPWSNHGVSATTFAVAGAIWLILTQWISAALGGYIAGRLRSRWIGTHTHEVFFRDTAHRLITWAVATILVAAVLSNSVMSGVGAAGHAGAEAASGGMQGAMQSTAGPGSAVSALSAYSIDRLFRSTGSAGPGTPTTDLRTETGHIIAGVSVNGSVPDADRAYLVDRASRTHRHLASGGASPGGRFHRVGDASSAEAESRSGRSKKGSRENFHLLRCPCW